MYIVSTTDLGITFKASVKFMFIKALPLFLPDDTSLKARDTSDGVYTTRLRGRTVPFAMPSATIIWSF